MIAGTVQVDTDLKRGCVESQELIFLPVTKMALPSLNVPQFRIKLKALSSLLSSFPYYKH